jgi:hypothetical protein
MDHLAVAAPAALARRPHMNRKPLMPKATAVWLVENTSLTFEQIAAFCGLHVLEVKGIADGDVAQGIKGMDPISGGQLTREEIAKAEADQSHELTLAVSKIDLPVQKAVRRGHRYTPLARRHARPHAVLWLLKNHPELKESQIMRLVGTTKSTIESVRDRTHWDSPNLQPQDPVTLGLCSQIDLDAEVQKSARRVERDERLKSGTLLPASETTAPLPTPPMAEIVAPRPAAEPAMASAADEEARVLASLRGLGSSTEPRLEEGDEPLETGPAMDDEAAGEHAEESDAESEREGEPRGAG